MPGLTRRATLALAFAPASVARAGAALLLVGSSTIALWRTASADLQPQTVINRGVGGATLADMMANATVLFAPPAPAAVVLYAGENDVAEGASAAVVVGRFRVLQRRRRTLAPPAPLVFMGLKPSPARAHLWGFFQAATRGIANLPAPERPNALLDLGPVLLDRRQRLRPELYAADGLHLNDQGYRLLAAALRRELARVGVESTGQSG